MSVTTPYFRIGSINFQRFCACSQPYGHTKCGYLVNGSLRDTIILDEIIEATGVEITAAEFDTGYPKD